MRAQRETHYPGSTTETESPGPEAAAQRLCLLIQLTKGEANEQIKFESRGDAHPFHIYNNYHSSRHIQQIERPTIICRIDTRISGYRILYSILEQSMGAGNRVGIGCRTNFVAGTL
jgi:hypothetical protein